jgi:hypothetical protein
MKKQEISSVFTVTTFPKGSNPKKEEVNVSGFGQTAIAFLRKQYPKFTKFVLEGFEINGNFIEVNLYAR